MKAGAGAALLVPWAVAVALAPLVSLLAKLPGGGYAPGSSYAALGLGWAVLFFGAVGAVSGGAAWIPVVLADRGRWTAAGCVGLLVGLGLVALGLRIWVTGGVFSGALVAVGAGLALRHRG